MSFHIFHHPACGKHENAPGHIESPERYRTVDEMLSKKSNLTLEEAPLADLSFIQMTHSRGHIDSLQAHIRSGGGFLDGDTGTNAYSWDASLRAAGATIAAVDYVLRSSQHAFCSIRPPGHHALADRAMGFCLFNNVAIGVERALASAKINRVAILDFDVHHGNGTEAIFYERANVFFSSIHQAPWYPGTGSHTDTGRGPGLGTTQNLPLAAGANDDELLFQWREFIRPAWEKFSPDIIFLSAGFDGDYRDPLAHLNYTPQGYETLTSEVCDWASSHNNLSIVSVLEGGYHCEALAEDVSVHIDVLSR